MMNSIEEALTASGVTSSTLSNAEKRALDEQGFVMLCDLIDNARLDQMRAAFEAIAASERKETSQKETGTRHPKDLLNQHNVFLETCAQPRILAAIHHILQRSFRLTQYSGRDPLPGFGQQGLHADWMPRRPDEPSYVVTAIWMLDEFTSDNGATRIVPGTHRLAAVPKAMADPASHHPEEKIVTAAAGSVLLFNGHLWHSGTRNNSQRSRRALQGVFHASEVVPPFAEPLHHNPAELPPAVRYFLGV